MKKIKAYFKDKTIEFYKRIVIQLFVAALVATSTNWQSLTTWGDVHDLIVTTFTNPAVLIAIGIQFNQASKHTSKRNVERIKGGL